MDPDQFIISDTSCLIALERIDKLEILKDLFSKVFITNEVAIEFGNTLPQWIVVRTVKNLNKQNELSKLVFRSLNIIPTLSGASTAQNQSFHSF